MKRKILFATLMILALNAGSILKAQTTTEEITTAFFDTYEKSPLQAVEYVFGTNKWMPERNRDGIEHVKTSLSSLLDLVGDYYGYEKITEKSVGESFKLVSYLVKYDREPLRFTFIFYKPGDKWQLQSFQYDENIDDDLEEAAKAYRLKENWE